MTCSTLRLWGALRNVLPIDSRIVRFGGAAGCQLSPERGSAGSAITNSRPMATRIGLDGSV